MPVTTIEASLDGYQQSVSTVYATAAASYVAGFSNTGGTTWLAGQRLNGADYNLFQAQIRWPLSAIPAGATILSTAIRVTNSGSPPGSRKDTYFLDRDPGAAITSADYVSPGFLNSFDLFATMPTANNGSNATYTLTGTVELTAKVQANIGGNIGCTVASDSQLTETPPTGDERWTFKSIEDGTAGNRPALIVTWTFNLAADHGSLTLSGQAAGTRTQRKVVAAQAVFALSGQDAALSYEATDRIAAETGSVALGGQDAGLRAQRWLGLDYGAVALSGQAAALRRNVLLGLDHGAVALSGLDAALRLGVIMAAAQGTVALAGFDLAMTRTRRLLAAQAAFALSAQNAALARMALLTAAQAAFGLSGQNAALLAGYRVAPARGDYALTGEDADLFLLRGIAAAYAAFVLSGQAAGFAQTWLAPSFRRLSIPAGHGAIVIGADGRTNIVGAG